MRIGSLFSGYGGLDMAVESVFPGARPAWFCEWDDAPSRILAHHWPDVPNLRDVTTIDWATMPPVDILTGGFPCQPFSAAGRREGENDERHLWPYVLEAIRALRPSYVLLENVAGLRSVGGVFDEPALRCVCGWFGRWGGVHYREGHEVRDGHGHSGTDRDGDEGAGSPCADAGHLRRDADNSESDESHTFADHYMDGHGSGCGSVSAPDRTSPDAQDGAGEDRAQDQRDPDLAGADRDTGSLPVDRGEPEQVPGAVSPAERAECSWEGVVSSVGGQGDCPACGGAVGDGSDGHVFRSGLGTVYRDLASLGMHVRWTSVRASDIGAPHHRERLFILATPSNAHDTTGDGEWARPESRQGGAGDASDTDGVRGQDRRHGSGARQELARVGSCDLPLPDTGSDGGRGVTERDCEPFGPELEAPRGGHTHRRGDSSADAERLGRERRGATPEQTGGTQSSADRLRLIDWGQYGPAVRRWERLTRPAPAPTELGTRGKPRLNAEFAEWMMGLPAGHITGVGLPRTAQLKAIGNGVVPQQAAAALGQLLALEAVTA